MPQEGEVSPLFLQLVVVPEVGWVGQQVSCVQVRR